MSVSRNRRLVLLSALTVGLLVPVPLARVAAQATEWAADRGADLRTADVIGDCSGLAEIVVERYREAQAGDIRVNCDTCKYRVALPFHEHAVGAAQLPHAHPADHHH